MILTKELPTWTWKRLLVVPTLQSPFVAKISLVPLPITSLILFTALSRTLVRMHLVSVFLVLLVLTISPSSPLIVCANLQFTLRRTSSGKTQLW